MEWQANNSIAELLNDKELDSIRQKQLVAKEVLMELDTKKKQLEIIISRAKRVSVLSDDEVVLGFFIDFWCFTQNSDVWSF